MLNELTIKDFLAKTSGNEPVPGGGSISALNGALAAALGEMVAGLTLGKKKYLDAQEEMTEIISRIAPVKEDLMVDIDRDSDAYNEVFSAFKMPKETEEQKAVRTRTIEEATKHAAEIPFAVAKKSLEIMPLLEDLVERGNRNAITDACVATMCARNAVLGAILNVEINLGSLSDTAYVEEMKTRCDRMKKQAIETETRVLARAHELMS